MAYKDEVNKANIIKLRELCEKLPSFCEDFFVGIEPRTSARTRVAYAYDLIVFFQYLKEKHPLFRDKEIKDFPLSLLEELTVTDLERFLNYVRYYENEGEVERYNGDAAAKRKLCSVKSLYRYFTRRELIDKNVADLLETPKLHDKNIIRLDPGEVAELLDKIESGEGLTKKQKEFHQKTVQRDFALIVLLLGTGIRISECVGLNLKDIDFREGCITIFRKGGKEQVVYFGDEVENALKQYLNWRKGRTPQTGHEQAVFLSLQDKRLTVRSAEELVKKYAATVTGKHITPHKLRSTYGTSLYRETGDIYLVADVLGHSDVNTTRKHYAAIEEDQKRLARNKVILRDEKPSNSEGTDEK